MFDKIVYCPICQQSCRLNKIYTYKVEINKRPNSISMRMFKKASLFAFMQDVESPIHWKIFTIAKCSNFSIGVFYVLQRVVNL